MFGLFHFMLIQNPNHPFVQNDFQTKTVDLLNYLKFNSSHDTFVLCSLCKDYMFWACRKLTWIRLAYLKCQESKL